MYPERIPGNPNKIIFPTHPACPPSQQSNLSEEHHFVHQQNGRSPHYQNSLWQEKWSFLNWFVALSTIFSFPTFLCFVDVILHCERKNLQNTSPDSLEKNPGCLAEKSNPGPALRVCRCANNLTRPQINPEYFQMSSTSVPGVCPAASIWPMPKFKKKYI
jgi:hypothetical protein